MGFGKAIVYVRLQRMELKLPLQVPFAARDFYPVEPPRHTYLDALTPETQRAVDCLPHRTAKRHALFKLQRNRFGDELCVQLRLVNLLNVDEDLALGLLRQVLFELFDFGALA